MYNSLVQGQTAWRPWGTAALKCPVKCFSQSRQKRVLWALCTRTYACVGSGGQFACTSYDSWTSHDYSSCWHWLWDSMFQDEWWETCRPSNPLTSMTYMLSVCILCTLDAWSNTTHSPPLQHNVRSLCTDPSPKTHAWTIYSNVCTLLWCHNGVLSS